MIKKLLIILITIGLLSITAQATVYKLTCTNDYSGSQETVKVEASSKSAALSKVKTDLAYAEYKNCS